MSLATESPEVLLARYGELWLKGRNRSWFERRLARNIRRALKPIAPGFVLEREHGMLIVRPRREHVAAVGQRLQEVFGLSSISPARGVEADPEAITEVALAVAAEALEGYPRGRCVPFRVLTRRSDKRFPMISMEVDRVVGQRLLDLHGAERLRVDLSRPELVLGINVRTGAAYVYAEKLAGAGGLPVGSVGRVVSLFSGGIDSPVATWMAMKRGLDAVFCTFHSYPYVGADFRGKVERLVRRLARYQNGALLWSVPLTRLQEAIRDVGPESYRTVLYRRAMQRLAARVAERERATALVTGESLGQVASQTLENLDCIASASALPVLRPLIGFDKDETIDVAQRIGTYETSIEPVADCCTVFQPRHPILRARRLVCESVEEELPLADLEREALEEAERKVVD